MTTRLRHTLLGTLLTAMLCVLSGVPALAQPFPSTRIASANSPGEFATTSRLNGARYFSANPGRFTMLVASR